MNIEKSIEILKEFRNYNKFYKEENRDLTITINLEAKESIDEAIETLLTAHEKENEEHKKECHNCDEYTARLGELETENRMLKSELEKEKEENMSYYYHIQGLEDDIRMHYISKYKIEKEIKKIKDSNTYGYVGEEWNDRDVVELLENLISEEE